MRLARLSFLVLGAAAFGGCSSASSDSAASVDSTEQRDTATRTPPVRPGVYVQFSYAPGWNEPLTMIDILPPAAGAAKWTVRFYNRPEVCLNRIAPKSDDFGAVDLVATTDDQAEIACEARLEPDTGQLCSFKFDGSGAKLWAPPWRPGVVKLTAASANGQDPPAEKTLVRVRDLDASDWRCDCPSEFQSVPPPSNYGQTICTTSGCRGDFDPLVLSFHGDAVQFAGKRVDFDFNGDGSHPLLDWVSPSSERLYNDPALGILALDLNGNGTIDDGRELFGSATVVGANGRRAATGFEALAQYDANHDGRVDAQDPIFGKLLVWTDSNVDGVSQPAELSSAAAAGVAALYLESTQLPTAENGRSYVAARARFDYQQHLCHAVTRYASDVWLAGSSPAVP